MPLRGRPRRFDDVVLALRGLKATYPVPGKINVLWVISHPDDVPAEEVHGFDLVFAASEPWARRMSTISGRPVAAMLQATDVRLRDVRSPVGTERRPVFVGGTNPRRPRQVVLDAVAAGVDLDVHGIGWAETPAEPYWRSEYVANEDLMSLYRSHGIVLADHWGDMAREGFLANRLFDAVASGVRVVSDPVPGLGVFEGAVQAYSSLEELNDALQPRRQGPVPDRRGDGRDRRPGRHRALLRPAGGRPAPSGGRRPRETHHLGRHRKNVRVGRYHGSAASTS